MEADAEKKYLVVSSIDTVDPCFKIYHDVGLLSSPFYKQVYSGFPGEVLCACHKQVKRATTGYLELY